ncbi:MAG: heme biosynthesis HemY N-terminal domain-containing protein [Parvularculaceae bacterium]
MSRILTFILAAIAGALIIMALLKIGGHVTGAAFGQQFDLPFGVVIGAAALGAIVLIAGTAMVKDLVQMPARMKARDAAAKRERGIAAVARGLEAVEVGDASGAQHHAKVAARNLHDMSLTRLLSARAAQLAGDDASASAAFSKMIDAPETEFLGLHGLFVGAMRKGERARAHEYAERAFKLRPNARWAFDAVLDLALDRGDWREARATLETGRKSAVVSAEKAARGEAALLTATAYAAAASGDDDLARREADAALKIASAFAPAAVLSARLHAGRGEAHKAAKILETAFAGAPESAIIMAHIDLFKDGSDAARSEKLERLAARNPDAPAAMATHARALLLKGEASKAIEQLESLLKVRATARDCSMMAEAHGAVYGPHAAQPWLERAAAAPRDPAPGATDGEFNLTRDGWSRLVREYIEHGRLAPPPLEGPPPGLAEHEFHLLAPPAPVTTGDDADDDGDAKFDNASPDGASAAADAAADEAPPADRLQDSTDEAPPAAGNDAADDNESADERLAKDADAARGVS